MITSSLSGNTLTLTYHDPNGNSQVVTLQLGSTAVTSSFYQHDQLGGTIYENSGTATTLSSVTLPNGTSYSFTYGSDGYLNSMTLPTGATISYSTANFLALEFSREYVATRTETVGNQTNVTSFAITCNNGAPTTSLCAQLKTVVTDAAQKRAIYVSVDGHIETASFYDDATGTHLLKQYNLCYGSNTPNASNLCVSDYTAHSQSNEGFKPTSINTQLDNGLVSRIEYDYDSFNYSYASCPDDDPSVCSNSGVQYASVTGSRGNETAMREYDYGSGSPGSLIRQTIKAYLHDANPAYIQDSYGNQRNIVDKVTQVSVYDGAARCIPGQTCSANLLAQTNYGYDQDGAGYRGRVTSVSKWVNLPTPHFDTTTYAYNSYGGITSITDPLNHTTSWGYADSWNAPNNACLPASGSSAFATSRTDALQHTTTASYYPCSGDVASIRDPNDVANNRPGTLFSYDLMKRVITTAFPDGGSTNVSYNDQANTVDTLQAMNSSSSIETFVQKDGIGRTTETQLKSDPQGTVYTDTTYDPMSRVACVSNPHRSSSAITDGQTCKQYDGLGRITVATMPDNTQEAMNYAGNQVTTTDEAGVAIVRTSDGLGRLTQVVEPGGLATDYAYTALGDLQSILQHGTSSEVPRSRGFSYDSLSRLITSNNPETGTICYGTWNGGNCQNGYDANSNLVNKTDARGIQLNYSYDALNRLTSKNSPGIGAFAVFGYDGFDESHDPVAVATNAVGRLSRISTLTAPFSGFGYDAMGRLIAESICLPFDCDEDGTVVRASRDLAGNITSVTYPDGRQIQQTWDSAGRQLTSNLVATGTGSQNYLESATYNPDGSPNVLTLGNGVSQTITENNRLQVGNMEVSTSLDPFSRPFVNHDYCYAGCLSGGVANNGNIWQIADNLIPDKTHDFNYRYDALNRITDFLIGAVPYQHFSPDSFGNTYETLHATFVPDFTGSNSLSGNNRINNLPCGTVTQPFDAAGNQLCDTDQYGGVTQRTIDPEGRLSKIAALNSNASPFVTYIYGADDTRIRKSNADGTFREYAYFDGVPMAERDENDTWTDYVYADSKRIARIDPTKVQAHLSGNRPDPSQTSSVTNNYVLSTPAYQVKAGDILGFSMYQHNASGGVSLGFTDGSNTDASCGADQRGDCLATESTSDAWVNRMVSLGDIAAGKTIQSNAVQNRFGPTGQFDVMVSDMTITSIDGTVTTLVGQGSVGQGATSCTATGASSWPTACTVEKASPSVQQVTIRLTNNSCSSCANQSPYAQRNLFIGSVSVGSNTLSSSDPSVTIATFPYPGCSSTGVLGCNGDMTFPISGLGPITVAAYGELDYGLPPHMQIFVDGTLAGEFDVAAASPPVSVAYQNYTVQAAGNSETTYFTFADHLGSSQMEFSSGGWPVSSTSFMPYGAEINPQTTTNHYKFTGKERDAESGLDYFGARYYASSMGRWMSPDWSAKAEPVPYSKLDDPQSLNLYSYVGNNPLSRADADGHDYIDWSRVVSWVSAHVAQVGTGIMSARRDYNARVAQAGSEAARDAAKPATGGPALGRALADGMRSDPARAAARAAKSDAAMAATVTKTNPGVNAATETAGVVGKVAGGVAVGIAVYNVATAPEGQKGVTAAGEGGGLAGAWGGGVAGAEGGGLIGSIFPGPGTAIGAAIGGIGGAIVGGIEGKKAGTAIYNDVTKKPE